MYDLSQHALTGLVFQGAALGYELLAHVFAHLDILETDYFGLQYTDEKSVTRWIDQHKSIKKQTCKQRGQSGIPQLVNITQLRAIKPLHYHYAFY